MADLLINHTFYVVVLIVVALIIFKLVANALVRLVVTGIVVLFLVVLGFNIFTEYQAKTTNVELSGSTMKVNDKGRELIYSISDLSRVTATKDGFMKVKLTYTVAGKEYEDSINVITYSLKMKNDLVSKAREQFKDLR